jgi:PAS domain S-box-containing protein
LYNATLFKNEAGEIQGVFAAARDVTKRKQAEAEIARRGEMLDLANDAITIRDVNDCITYWNRGAEHLYGWKEEEVLGMVTHELFQTVFPESLDVTKQALYRDGVWNGELIHTTRDNARIIVESHWTLYHDKDGRPSAIFEVNNDVTEQKQAQLALKRARDDLEQIVHKRTRELQEEVEERKVTEQELQTTTEELRGLTNELRETTEELTRSNKELEQFAYIASHDLQEPLRTVMSSIGLLESWYKGTLGAEADTFIGYAVDGTKHMQQLIKDLLAYSRVTSRGETFKPVHCEDIVQRAIDNLRVSIEESGATITVPKQPLPMVMGDETQLTQLFQNLIGNAIKFRSDRPPAVQIGVEPDARGDKWQFSIKDNGIGMDMEYANKIFTIFQRLHTTEQYPGTGVGLALCKKIVERHGGEIWVESTLGEGSTFYFTLQL